MILLSLISADSYPRWFISLMCLIVLECDLMYDDALSEEILGTLD